MSVESFLNGKVTLHAGDSRDVLKTLADDSIDSIVTDPPYALVSIVKRFANSPRSERTENTENPYGRTGRGFMGQKWDTGETAFDPAFWAECLRVLKPGGHLVASAGTRTVHRMVCAIEDAGFEIRDSLQWLYGSGFPKSHDVAKGLSKQLAGPSLCEEWQGWGTALKPAAEIICLAQKPNEYRVNYDMIGSQLTMLESSVWSLLPARTAETTFGLSPSEFAEACASAQWSAGERSNTRVALSEAMGTARFVLAMISSLNTVSLWKRTWDEGSLPANTSTTETELSTTIDLRTLRFLLSKITPASIIQAHAKGTGLIADAYTAERSFNAAVLRLKTTLELSVLGSAISQAAQSSLDAGVRPAVEPICLARKPLDRNSTVAANVLQHGTGALNIDGCRVPAADGDAPLSWEHGRGMGYHGAGDRGACKAIPIASGRWPANIIHDGGDEVLAAFPDAPGQQFYVGPEHGDRPSKDSGSAARFFYTSKADSHDRAGSRHPTVKPVDLMQWLCRLVTPPGGTVLDPFAGTGTTGEAAFREGFNAVLIEREPEYQVDIRRRLALCMAGPDERRRESIKAKIGDVPFELGSLFAAIEAAE